MMVDEIEKEDLNIGDEFKKAKVIDRILDRIKKPGEEIKNPYFNSKEEARKWMAENYYDNARWNEQEKIIELNPPQKIFDRKFQTGIFKKIQPLFYDRSGNWWLWNKKNFCWVRSDDVDILNMFHDKTGKNTIKAQDRTEIINSLKQEGRRNIPNPIKKTWIQFKNEIYDIATGEIFEATPNFFVTNPIPYRLHPEKFILTPNMDKIFEQWVGKDYVKTLYEIIAYCLLPDYPMSRMFCLIGGGMNGKSCFLDLLQKFLGKDNITSTELDTLLSSRFEVTRLHKKLLCVMGETNFSEMQKTSILKKLTGRDLIGFEYKNKTPFEDFNYAKIVIATNNLPTTTDKTIGFYRRWVIIDFPNTFSEKKDILSEIPEEEYEALALKCMHILFDLLEKREFHKEGSIEIRMKRYEDKSNPLEKFVKEFLIEGYGEDFITHADFSKKLNAWLKENRFRSMADNSISSGLKKLGFERGRKTFEWAYDGKGGQIRGYFGIKWKD